MGYPQIANDSKKYIIQPFFKSCHVFYNVIKVCQGMCYREQQPEPKLKPHSVHDTY